MVVSLGGGPYHPHMTVAQTPTASPRVTVTEEIVDLVFDFVDRMSRHLERSAAEFDLSPPQALALLRLDQPLPMRELAEKLFCDASNITGIVDRLEGRHLVERKVDEADRRVKNLLLTPEGMSLLEQLKARLLEDVPAIGSLSKADQRALRDLLRHALHDV
jgi:MarR family transcriptional regulator, organic hydroperoxide resistance regulator